MEGENGKVEKDKGKINKGETPRKTKGSKYNK